MTAARDVWIVLGKEWLELRSSDSGWVTASTLVAFLAIAGVFVPWQLGLLWVEGPWVALIWAWMPMFLVTTVTADSVAGERERHTLETLLATRLSDAAILWGKWLAGVTWVWCAMALCLPTGLITVNLVVEGGPHLPTVAQAAGLLAASFAGGGLGAAVGVLVSMRATSVRHAQQILAIGALLIALVPVGLLRLLPQEWTAGVLEALAWGSPARLAWTLAAVLTLLGLPVLVLAQTRFRRGKIPLK